MWIQDITLPFRGPKEYDWEISSDWQIGSRACDERRVDYWIDKVVANPRSFWSILGDGEDDDRPSTRSRKRQSFADRGEVLTNAGRDHMAWLDKSLIPRFKKLSARPCAGVLAGHHWTELTTILNSVQYLCREGTRRGKHKIPYLGEMSSFVRLTFKGEGPCKGVKFTILVHVQHGTGGGSALGSALRKLAKTSEGFRACAYVRAHSCALEAAKRNRLWTREDDITPPELLDKVILFMNIGCATRGFDLSKREPLYPEMSMLGPATMGWGTIKIKIRKPLPWEDQRQLWVAELNALI